jgi:lipopolysaccharide/colanic/teichoic acid biosynthesis glycosyltransferase
VAKRIFDIGAAILILAIGWPVIAGVAIAVRCFLGTPVLFRQTRIGVKGRQFQIAKFRTMTDQRDEAGQLYPDSVRLTRFGRFLRSTSLDELPELFNVLRGDMSLVGPRPLLVEYLPLYSARQAKRHDVRPGLTGWAQVNGRNSLSWPDRFELDVWYVEHRTFALDMQILCKTLLLVIQRSGINAVDSATMTRFRGNDPGEQP